MNDKYQIPLGLQSVKNEKQLMFNEGTLNNFSLHIDSHIQNHVFNIDTNESQINYQSSMSDGRRGSRPIRKSIKNSSKNKRNKSQKFKN